MWEESLIESKGSATPKRKWMGWPLSIAFHGAVLSAIGIASFWNVAAVEPVLPAPPLVFQTFVVPVAPPALGNRAAVQHETKPAATPAPSATPVIVPEQDSNQPPESSQTPTYYDNSTTDGEWSPGVPWGVDGGDPNTTSDGVPGGLPAVEDPPVYIERGIESPVLIQKVEPPYPKLALITRKQGIVVLQAIITKTGTVENVTILRSADPLLDQAAMAAVKRWIYRPATIHGRPIKVYFTVTVKFHLR
jgi:protein TonB